MRILGWFDRLVGTAIVASNCVGSACIFVVMLGLVADITARKLLNAPISGVTELVTMSVVALLYLQIAYTLRAGAMTRSDAVLGRLIQRRPVLGHLLGIVFSLAGAALMAAIMTKAWPKWVKAYENDFYVGVVGVFAFPDWPRLLIVFIGCGLTALQFLIFAAESARAIRRPSQAETGA
jgi:TRAP-type mannitol/chloroaromatic compound transport system permease small subunit